MISKKQKKKLSSIAKKYKLDLIVLFGSRSVNQERKNSDWDLAICSKINIDNEKFWNIWSEIEGIYFKKIDLINLNQLEDPLLSKNIFKKGICLFESENGFFDNFYVNSIYNYIDYKPLFKIEELIVQKKLANL